MKTMTFEQAKKRLARIAKGEYHAIKYELTVPTAKRKLPEEAECSVYIHGGEWYGSDTWEGAFKLMAAGGDRRKRRAPNPEEAPL